MQKGICYIINSYPPRIGGAEILVENLSRELSRAGFETTVITRRVNGEPLIERQGRLTVIRVPVFGTRMTRSATFRVLSSFLLILLKNRFDILHAHSLDSPASIAAGVAPILGKEYYVTIHNTGKVGELLKRKGGHLKLSKIAQTCRGVVSINSDITRELISAGFPEEKIVFIPNGVDTDRFAPADHNERDRLMKGLSIFGRTIYLFVGNFHSQKGIDTLIKAWKTFQDRVGRTRIALLMIGDGVLMKETKELIKKLDVGDTVHLLGRKTDTRRYYRIADCFVQPSRWEGLSIALLEALSSGCAVIATPVGGTKEVIRDGENGILTPVDDPESLAGKLELLFDNPELRSTLGREARSCTIARYSIKTCAARHIALYLGIEERENTNAEANEKVDSPTVECDEQAAGEDAERVPQFVT